MLRKKQDQRIINRAPGVDIQVLVEPTEMYNAGRLCAKILLAPGAALPPHMHENEMESFCVLRGTCKMTDNGETLYLNEGDVLVTLAGENHSIANDTDSPVELMAMIISVKQGEDGRGVDI